MAPENMDDVRHCVVELMRAFITGPDRGMGLAGQLESALESAFPDNNDVSDIVLALASYRPEGGPHLYDQSEMIRLLERYLPVIERLAAGAGR